MSGARTFYNRKMLLSCLFFTMAFTSPAFSDGGDSMSSEVGNSAFASATVSATIVRPPSFSCDRALRSVSINIYVLGREDGYPHVPLIVDCEFKDGRAQFRMDIPKDNQMATYVTDLDPSVVAVPKKYIQTIGHGAGDEHANRHQVIEFIYNYE